MDEVHLTIFETAIAPMAVASSSQGLLATSLPDAKRVDSPRRWLERHLAGVTIREGTGRNARFVTTIQEYLAGRSRDLDLPLDMRGTPFQISVWRQLCLIPYGQVITYGELARRVGKPGAARAVGAANGANPIPLVVPCHRVVAAGGALGGFGGGLPLKRKLLELEGALPAEQGGAEQGRLFG